jgi:SAM-dependent methyltransferase
MTTNLPPFFESLASPERHIDRLYTIAKLRGIQAAFPAKCNVLEIGCGRGVNLIPQAVRYSEAKFVGVDIDAVAIGQARSLLKQLDVQNCICETISIEEFAQRNTIKFDYIICHGLFAWADPTVRRAILKVCSQMSPVGVALVSYNVLPGWYMRGILAHYVQADDDAQLSVAERLTRVRLHFDNLSKEEDETAFRGEESEDPMTKEIKACRAQSEGFLWHEILNRNSRGFYLRQLVEILSRENLNFIGDSLPTRMRWWRYDELAEEAQIPELTNQEAAYLEKEQQLDHALPIPFRSSLFSLAQPTEHGEYSSAVVSEMYISSHLVPFSEMPDLVSDKQEIFCAPNSISTEVELPILKAALVRLREAWPEAVQFVELHEHAVALSGADSEQSVRELQDQLVRLYFANMVELHPQPVPCTKKLGDNPIADVFAREQASFSSWVTTVRHEYQPIDRLEAELIRLLDGSRTKEQIVSELRIRLEEMGITPSLEGEEVESPEEVMALILEHVEHSLELFRERGVLVELHSN